MNDACPPVARRSLLVRLSAAAAAAAGVQALPGTAAPAVSHGPQARTSALGPAGSGDYRLTERVQRCYQLARY